MNEMFNKSLLTRNLRIFHSKVENINSSQPDAEFFPVETDMPRKEASSRIGPISISGGG